GVGIEPDPFGFGAVVAGSKIGRLLRNPRRLKSPPHCAAVGTLAWPVLPLRMRAPSYAAKKKLRLRRMRPPIAPPKRLYRSGAFFNPAKLVKKFAASRSSLRKNSCTLPWKVLAPDLVDAFTWTA